MKPVLIVVQLHPWLLWWLLITCCSQHHNSRELLGGKDWLQASCFIPCFSALPRFIAQL